MKKMNWLKPGGFVSVLLALIVSVGLFSIGITAEVPVGGVAGHIEMGKQGIGLPNADIIFYRKTQDGWEGQDSWRAVTDERGEFSLRGIPTGLYSASVYGKVHSHESAAIMVSEGQTSRLDVTADRSPDSLSLNAGSRVFKPGEVIDIRVNGSTLADALDLKVFQVEEESFSSNQNLADFLYGVATNRNRLAPEKLATLRAVREINDDLKTKDIEGVFVHESKLDTLPYGVYLVQAKAGPESAFAWLTVTDIALITKTEPKRGEAFVCDIETGEPVSGAELFVVRGGSQSSIGASGADGLVEFDPIVQNDRMTLVSAKHGEARAYTWFYKPYDEKDRLTGHFVSDRPIYRPGDKAHFKAILRKGEPGAYTIPAGQAAEIRVYNPNGDEIQKLAATIDEWGSVSGSVDLNTGELQGSYSVEIETGEQTEYGSLNLASYRKPHFEIEVAPSQNEVVRGDTLAFTVRCTSYTGEPIVGADVQADLFSGYDYWSSPFDEDYGDDSYSGYGLEFNRQYEVKTDGNGEAVIQVNTRKVGGEGEYSDFADTRYRLSVNVADEGGRYYSADGSAVAKRGEFDLAAEFDRYVANPGTEIELTVKQALTEGAKGTTSASVSFGREIYSKEGYRFIEESKSDLSLESGEGSVTLKPEKGGSYKAIVAGKDSKGNEVKTETYLWVSGGGEIAADSQIALAMDKRTYDVGDTAKIVIRGGAAGGSVWFTAEGTGILDSQIVKLDGGDAIVELPITEAFAPNFSISVCRVVGKEFVTTSRGGRVGLESRELEVTITPDRNKMHPGETVNLLVSTQDVSGNPVPSDVALRVVDEGIYQIREDNEDPLDSFYPSRYSEVSTNYSFPSIYLDGEDKGGGDVSIRSDFADTAFWSASVKTDESGKATLAVKVPDNLTTWRVTGSAVTKSTLVGKGVSSVVSMKEIMLRMSLPQFLNQDDAQDIAFTITNSTDTSMNVAYELEATGLKLEGDSRGTVSVEPNSREVVTRRVLATTAGTAKLKMIGRGGGFSDGLEMSVDVHARTETRHEYYAGSLEASKAYVSTLNLDSKAVTGELTLSLADSPFSAMEPMLDGLIEYPYGCVEQTMSRFVPAALLRSYWRETGRPRADLDPKIDEAIKRGFARLRELQNYDGSFGWFGYDQADPAMMALVLDGMHRIASAGVPGTDRIVERTLSASADVLKSAEIDTSEKRSRYLSLAAAHARYQSPEGVKRVLTGSLEKLSPEGLGAVAAGYHSLSLRDEANREALRAQGMLAWQALLKQATVTQFSASFGDARIDALGIEVALAYGNADIAEKLIESLLKSRDPRGWGDTWRTSQALKAAVTYVRARGFSSGVGTATVLVNGQTIWTVNWEGLAGQSQTTTVPLSGLKTGGNRVEVRFEGTGAIQYSMDLTQGVYAQSSKPQANPATFTITREYLPMQTRRLEDGSLRLLPSKRASEEFKPGDVFRCRLTIRTRTDMEYVAIEDPIPSNCRIVEADSPEPGFDWSYWWSNSTFGDDRAAFFVRNLSKGEHVIEYAIRAEANGHANALPATAYPMYLRDVRASTAQNKAEIKP